ncbi:MAG: glycosyltransferase family 39 protein [Patescibacteria group bacterium]
MKLSRTNIIIFILFIFLFVLLFWNSFSAPFERDEGEYAYSAWLLRSGGTPYQDSFLQKPPLIIYTYWLGQMISPLAVWPPRALAAIFVFLTSILIYLIATKEWGKIVGTFSAFLFLPLISFPPLSPFAANTEKFMILPIVALLALFVYYKNSRKSWPYILAGLFSALAIFYKPICLPVILFIIIFWLFKLYRSVVPRKLFIIAKPILLIGMTAIVVAIVLLVPFFKVWHNFFQEVFIFNLSYVNAFVNPLANFGGYLLTFLHYWWILLFLLIGLLFKRPKNILYYFVLLFVLLLTVFSTPSGLGHYYLILMPFLALFCGASFGSFLESSTGKQKALTTIIILPIVLLIMLSPFQKQFFMSPQKLSEWVYGTVNPFGESQEVASHLAKITNVNDFVFVAGSEPQIYYYAQRKSPTRFVITYPFNLPTPYKEQYQTEAMNDLEKNLPQAIVVSQRNLSGLWYQGSPEIFIKYLTDLTSKNYQVVGGYVWDNMGGHWQEPISTELIQNASLLLLAKNK